MERAKPKTDRQSQRGLLDAKRKADTASVKMSSPGPIRCANASRQESRKSEALQPAAESIPVAASAPAVKRRTKADFARSPSAGKVSSDPLPLSTTQSLHVGGDFQPERKRKSDAVPEASGSRSGGTPPAATSQMGDTGVGESLATRRRRIAGEREAQLLAAGRAARPDGLDAMGRTQKEFRAEALDVLRRAHLHVQAGMPLVDAVQEAGEGGISAHYAQRVWWLYRSRALAVDSRTARSTRHALALLEDVIFQAGGVPPLRKSKPGPKVGGPPSREEVERRRALYAAGMKVGAR